MKVVTVPCSFDNYSYLLICEESREAAIVDPNEAYPLMAELENNNVRLTTIFCTHHHHDHVGGINDLKEHFGDLKVYCHHSDESRIPLANTFVDDGAPVVLGSLEGNILYTPGHTTGSICYLFGEHLFTGDTLFGAGCGRLFEGSAEQMYQSLTGKIVPLVDSTKIYFGHEYTMVNLQFALTVEPDNHAIHTRLKELQEQKYSSPSTLLLEKQTNPFLRSHSEDIHGILRDRFNMKNGDSVEAFSLIRQLRNSF